MQIVGFAALIASILFGPLAVAKILRSIDFSEQHEDATVGKYVRIRTHAGLYFLLGFGHSLLAAYVFAVPADRVLQLFMTTTACFTGFMVLFLAIWMPDDETDSVVDAIVASLGLFAVTAATYVVASMSL